MIIPLYNKDRKKPKEIEIETGVTVLIGPNGIGKTYSLQSLQEWLEQNDKDVLNIDIYSEGHSYADELLNSGSMRNLAKRVVASEGQRVYDILIDKYAPKLGDFVKTISQRNKEGYILIDGCDSGVSIDLMLSIRYLFNFVLNDCKNSNINIYVIITSNSFELVYDYNSIWLPDFSKYKYNETEYFKWRNKYKKIYNKINEEEKE